MSSYFNEEWKKVLHAEDVWSYDNAYVVEMEASPSASMRARGRHLRRQLTARARQIAKRRAQLSNGDVYGK